MEKGLKNNSLSIHRVFQNNEPSTLIKKLDTKFDYYEIDGEFVISTITDEVKENAYVASPYALLINYSEDELVKIVSRFQRGFSWLLIKVFAYFLRATQIDKAQTLNNYMLSTNSFSEKWERLNVHALEQKAIERYAEHALIIRSVNQVQNPKLFDNLSQQGWIAVVVRQVYIFDDKEHWAKKRDTIKDRKLLNSKRFTFEKVNASDVLTCEEAEQMYMTLYLQKYSTHNIHFTAKYFQEMIRAEVLELYVLHDNEQKINVGMVGFSKEEKNMTVPMIGYDMTYSPKEALYRRLMMFAMTYAMEHDLVLNMSSGAADFKRTRGAKASLEYMFVKIEHLPFFRRVAWQTLEVISRRFYTPMLLKLKL